MRELSRFEANLARVVQAIFQRAPIEQALAVLRKPTPRPACLSRDAVEWIQDALAKGCIHFLARHGWMTERFLRDGVPASGRLWQRTPPAELGLTFSRQALDWLLELLSSGSGETTRPRASKRSRGNTTPTVGDRLLLVLAFDALRDHAPGKAMIREWPALHEDGLCRLAFLGELLDGSNRYRIDWLPWTSGVGACILETLQDWLAKRWETLERSKTKVDLLPQMQALGSTQRRVLGEYLDAIEAAGRRDLARCFLAAGANLLADRPSAGRWVGRLDLRAMRLADRPAVFREAFAFLIQLERMQTWQQDAVGVGYFDEGYQASQLWKSTWERFDANAVVEHARAVMREVSMNTRRSREGYVP